MNTIPIPWNSLQSKNMSSKDSLGDRMKSGYEDAYRIKLPIRSPVIIRIDGKSFHTYTKKCEKPFDRKLVDVMNLTATYLCSNVQNCQLAYVQSDEISLLLVNYKELNTESWFNNNLQKMVSVAAGMASAIFTQHSYKIFDRNEGREWSDRVGFDPIMDIKPAVFDARAFLLPKEEVCNYLLWRQQDCTRNSVQMLARSLYSHKECNNKNNADLQEMTFKKGKNWNDLPTSDRRGRCIIKKTLFPEMKELSKSYWEIDNEIPNFSEDRDYINKLVFA